MKKTFLKVKLPISIFKEGKYFIAYTTALDLSTSGKTYEEVKQRFDEAVEIFFEEIIRKGTFSEVLQELGWREGLKRPVVFPEDRELPIFIIRNNLRILGISVEEYLGILKNL